MVNVTWDQPELMVVSRDGELVTTYDYPFAEESNLFEFAERYSEIPERTCQRVSVADVSIYRH